MTLLDRVTSLLLTSTLLLTLAGCKEAPGHEAESTKQAYYTEQHRPQFHFTPEANWMNDPNGMFYYGGKYHLFYQYFPDSTVWGPMHWGHAESTDMLHWQHLPIGLYPDSIGCIFSGGAVVDVDNTSGLGTDDTPPVIATFTHHDFVGEKAKTNDFQKQSVAYSIDGGYDWTKYKGNPVIPNTEKIKDFRDPKVIWHEPSAKWILTLAAYDKVKMYASSDLLEWTFLSDFGIAGDQRLWECPDLFSMQVEGSDEKKYVLIVSIQKEAPNEGTATSYFIGDFDGKSFTADPDQQQWLDYGTDNYAFVTWDNIPSDDGRTLGIGWMSNWQYAQVVPTENWRSTMTLPRELSLHKTPTGYRLHSNPVKEYEKLKTNVTSQQKLIVTDTHLLQGDFDPTQCELNITIDETATTASTFGIKLSNDFEEHITISFDKNRQQMTVDRTASSLDRFSKEFYEGPHTAPIDFGKEELDLRIIIDATSVEIFANEGELNFTSIFFPTKTYSQLSLFADGGKWSLERAEVYSIDDVWR